VLDPEAVKRSIESCKAFRYGLDDRVPEVEEQIAEALDLEHYPDNEDYEGPEMVDADGNGYAIKVSVVRERGDWRANA
jgi:hypothetical protein